MTTKKQNPKTQNCCILCTCDLEKSLLQNVQDLDKCYKEKMVFLHKESAVCLKQIQALEAKKKTTALAVKNAINSHKNNPTKALKDKLIMAEKNAKTIVQSLDAANKNLIDLKKIIVDSNSKYKSFVAVKASFEKVLKCFTAKPKSKTKMPMSKTKTGEKRVN